MDTTQLPELHRALVLDENNEWSSALTEVIESHMPNMQIYYAPDVSELIYMLQDESYDLLILESGTSPSDGITIMRKLRKRRIEVPVMFYTNEPSVSEAVKAMRHGAVDYLPQQCSPTDLCAAIARCLKKKKRLLGPEDHCEDGTYMNMVGKSRCMVELFDMINKIAKSNCTVLLQGETGTGKEMVARAIHMASSQRRSGPFVAFSCAAFPPELLSSELFGFEKGAFTGAISQRKGRFELAHGGTVLIDEVGDLTIPAQAHLLRVIQERKFERLGGTETLEVDVRLIAATNRSLERMVEDHTFRQDLYFRFDVVQIEVPPLRERVEDIPLLASHFCLKHSDSKRTLSLSDEVDPKRWTIGGGCIC